MILKDKLLALEDFYNWLETNQDEHAQDELTKLGFKKHSLRVLKKMKVLTKSDDAYWWNELIPIDERLIVLFEDNYKRFVNNDFVYEYTFE